MPLVAGVVAALLLGGCWSDGDDAGTEEVDAGQEAPGTDPDGPDAGPPTAPELLSVVPGPEALAGGPWQYSSGVTELADDHEDEGPLSICGFSSDDPANPLIHLIDDRSIEVGAGARYRDEGEASEVSLVIAVVPGAADHLRDARARLPECGGSGIPEIGWPEQGDEVAAFGLSADTSIGPDGGMPGSSSITVVFVRVGEVVVGLVTRSVDAEWADLPPAPTPDELAELVGRAVDGVEALAAGETPPAPEVPTAAELGEALPPVDALPDVWEQDVDLDPLGPGAEPAPVCAGADGSAIGDIVDQRVPRGTTATYEPEDRDSTVEVAVAYGPLDEAAAAVTAAAADLDRCAAAGVDEAGFTLERLDAPALGEATVAWRLTAGAEADGRLSPGTTITHRLVAVDDVVVWVAVTDEPADPGEPDGVTLDETGAEAFVAAAVERVGSLR